MSADLSRCKNNLTIGDRDMGQTKFLTHVFRSLLIVTLVLFFSAIQAQSAWQWKMSLKIDEVGESMYMPSAIGFDKESQRYYVVDTGRNRLVSFDLNGKFLRAFTADDRLEAPFDMVRLDNGILWVVEKGRNSLTRIDIGAKEVKPFILRDGGRQVFPDRISFDGGKLYVLDRSSGQVLRYNDDLVVEQRFGCSTCLAGLADFVIVEDALWALEPREKQIFRFNADGTIAEKLQLGDEIDFPVSLAVEPFGFIYVLDRHQSSVFVYNVGGHFMYQFLGPGQAEGKVYFARQLRLDPWGHLCVVDEGNGRVEIYDR